eukprot:1139892-Amphidinium_carterae.1
MDGKSITEQSLTNLRILEVSPGPLSCVQEILLGVPSRISPPVQAVGTTVDTYNSESQIVMLLSAL